MSNKKHHTNVKVLPVKPRLNIDIARRLRQELVDNDIKEPQLSILMIHAAQETAGFNKELAISNNNFGGVKYQKDLSAVATPSTDYFAPAREDPKKRNHKKNAKGTPYAHFSSMKGFAQNWIPYANIDKIKFENDIGAPIDASDLADYVHRLKLNRYYQDPEIKYLKDTYSWDKTLKKELPDNDQVLAIHAFWKKYKINPGKPKRTIFSDNTKVATPILNRAKLLPDNTIDYNDIVPDLIKIDPITKLPLIIQPDSDRNILQLRPVNVKQGSNSKIGNSEKRKTDRPFTDLHSTNEYTQPSTLDWGPSMGNEWNELLPYNTNIFETYSLPLAGTQHFPLEKGVETLREGMLLDATKQNGVAEVKGKYSTASLIRELPFSSSGDRELEYGGNFKSLFPFKSGADENIENNGAADNYSSRVVNIHLNAPMIGNFTVSTKDAGGGLNDLKYQVEEVLIEVLNSANAIH